MKPSSTFQFNRFINLLKNELIIYYMGYLVMILIPALAAFVMLVIAMTDSSYFYSYEESIIIYVAICLAFIGSSFFELTSKHGTQAFLMRPGSTLEKYLVQVFLRFVVFIPVMLLVYLLTCQLSLFTATIINRFNGFSAHIEPFSFTLLWGKVPDWKDISTCIAIFSIACYLFAARLFFKRFAVIKSTVLGLVVVFVCLTFMVILSHLFFPLATHGYDIRLADIPLRGELTSMKLYTYTLVCLSWLFFLPLGYYLLKDKHV